MPGIDFAALRARIAILDVLVLLDFQPVRRNGHRLRGLCPMQCSHDPRAFVVNVATHRYYCHCCHHYGNQLELWSQAKGLPIFHAARDLCERLNIQVPQIHRW
jgi:DNA primase